MSKINNRIAVERKLSAKEATAMVGQTVEALEPNLKPGTVLSDAESGETLLAYLPLEDAGRLRRAVMGLDYGAGLGRQKNYRSKSRTFGYAPKRPVVLREGCSMSAIASTMPDLEKTLEDYADIFSEDINEIDPEIAPRDRDALRDVLPDWRMGKAKVWTSGVINDTAALPYHRDGFNFPTWSAMPVVRRGVRGGHLHLPEYDLVIPCADSTVTFFPGYKYVHGVTPITRTGKTEAERKKAYRVSIVYYALKGMKNCREYAEETALSRQRRTERELDMAKRLASGDRSIKGATKKK